MPALIVVAADFEKRPYQVPDQTENPDFEDFLMSAEKELFIRVFGFETWKKFEADELPGEFEDGAEYEEGGILYKYNGLKSIFVPLIYAEWLREKSEENTTAGVLINTVENGELMGPQQKIVKAWNAGSRLLGNEYERENTFFGYYKANEGEYSFLQFKELERINTLDI